MYVKTLNKNITSSNKYIKKYLLLQKNFDSSPHALYYLSNQL